MDPNTGRLVNVAPLFELTGSTSFEALAQEVDNAIRTIICYSNVEDFPRETRDACHDLFNIRDMFARLSESSIAMPEKKAAK